MSLAWFSYTNVSRPIDFDRFTPDAVLRAAQQSLGVTADGAFGERTKAALLARAQRDQAPADTIAAIRGLQPGETINRVAWTYLVVLGLTRLGFPLSAENPISIGGAEPMFARPRATTPPSTPRPQQPAPAPPPPPPPPPPPQGGASPASLAGSLAEFYRNNTTTVLVGGVGILAIAGLGIYFATREDDEPSRGELPPPRRPMPGDMERERRPMPRDTESERRPMPRDMESERRPMPRDREPERPQLPRTIVREVPSRPSQSVISAANALGLRPDADVGSIRSAYAREAGKYPLRDPESLQRRNRLKAARDTMLQARGAY